MSIEPEEEDAGLLTSRHSLSPCQGSLAGRFHSTRLEDDDASLGQLKTQAHTRTRIFKWWSSKSQWQGIEGDLPLSHMRLVTRRQWTHTHTHSYMLDSSRFFCTLTQREEVEEGG